MKNILVTGANGQLGKCLQELSVLYPAINFVFKNSKELNITQKEEVNSFFNTINFDFCVNCAAYTAVDKAEEDSERAEIVNALGVKYLAEACQKSNTTLIHVSTDFVFDGKVSEPYSETDITNPLSVYGQTKLNGERKIQECLDNYFIIRTSWLYSEYGNNFMKTMLKLGTERDELNIVSDQIGSPTYAKDLAEVILNIITNDAKDYGVYHYANEGVTSWYGFAKAIFDISNTKVIVNEIPSTAYLTPAVRPKYSVLNKNKIKETLNITIPNWEISLQKALSNLEND